MTMDTWLLFALAIVVASISPGPNVLIVVVNTLRFGFKGAFFTIVGNIICLFLVALLATIGVGAAIATAPLAFIFLKVAGGGYLIWMGVKMIRVSFSSMDKMDVSNTAMEKADPKATSLILEGFTVSASNPKAILFLTAIFPQFLNINSPVAPQFAIMFATIIALAFIVHGFYGLMASSLRDRPINIRVKRWMARVTGGTFIGLGASIALTR